LPVVGAYAIAIVALMIALGGGAYALQGRNSVDSGDIKKETIRSSDLLNGDVRRVDISDAAEGARAYGTVSASGEIGASKGVTMVSHPVNGGYCITPAAGIDPSTAPLLVGVKFDKDNTPATSVRYAQQVVPLVHCPPGTLEVAIFDTGLTGGLGRADNPFSFAIP
jgi:hypothetical protein